MRNWLIVFLLVVSTCRGQDKPPAAQVSMPSKEEVSELLSKADQKVSAFEEAVKNAKPHLDNVDPKLATNYLDAASAAHTIILGMQKKGPSSEALVGLLATLDDLSLDAANASVYLLKTDEQRVIKGKQPAIDVLAAVIVLNTAGTACNDIAELIMHATLRYVHVEEELLGKLLDSQK